MDELDQEHSRYTREVRTRAAKLMREEGLPLFDAMDKAQEQIASERKAETRKNRIISLGQLFAGRRL